MVKKPPFPQTHFQFYFCHTLWYSWLCYQRSYLRASGNHMRCWRWNLGWLLATVLWLQLSFSGSSGLWWFILSSKGPSTTILVSAPAVASKTSPSWALINPQLLESVNKSIRLTWVSARGSALIFTQFLPFIWKNFNSPDCFGKKWQVEEMKTSFGICAHDIGFPVTQMRCCHSKAQLLTYSETPTKGQGALQEA